MRRLKVTDGMDAAEPTPAVAVIQAMSVNYTMTTTDGGMVTNLDTVAAVITLPATVVGMTFTLRSSGT